MNLATVVLMALAVHFGGAEIDLARDVSMEWFRSSRLERSWGLQSRNDGAYTFAAADRVSGGADSSTVVVERLSAPDRTYSVTHLRGDEVETVSVVALVDLRRGSTVGRAGPPGSPIYVEEDGILVAFGKRDVAGVAVDSAAGDGDAVAGSGPADSDGSAAGNDDAVAGSGPTDADGADQTSAGPVLGRYEITRGRGLVTLIDAVTAQVLTLRF
jgi:hypothetical protein